jgi:hypothetical protein
VTSSDITCNSRSLIHRCFPKNNLTYAIYRNHFSKKSKFTQSRQDKIKNEAVLEDFFLKSESFRNNLRFLVYNLQVFFKIVRSLQRFNKININPGVDKRSLRFFSCLKCLHNFFHQNLFSGCR